MGALNWIEGGASGDEETTTGPIVDEVSGQSRRTVGRARIIWIRCGSAAKGSLAVSQPQSQIAMEEGNSMLLKAAGLRTENPK